MTACLFRLSAGLSLLAALSCTPAIAQWSSDPSTNLTIADRSSEQIQAKMVPTADGGFYVSWFDNSGGGYDVYLQRLDAAGNEMFAHNGVLVADRDFDWTQDYGLAVDAEGNALLTYGLNDSDDITQVAVQKVAPDGTLLWAKGGVVVSHDTGNAYSPKIAATDVGSMTIAWSGSNGSIVAQKLDGNGTALWGADGVSIVPPSGASFMADIHADPDGNAIVSWGAQLSTFNRQMWAQKLAAADGSNLWGSTPVKVFDGTDGALQFGYFPPFIPDGKGGAVFVWYTVNLQGTVHVQHIKADGSAAFAQNGVLASIDDSQNHFEPAGAYDATTGDIYAVWREADAVNQSQNGVYAQRIDSSGARKWGDGGKVLVPLSTTGQSQVDALALPGGVLMSWVSDTAPAPMPIHVTRLAADGEYVWASEVVDIKTAATGTSRATGALSTQGYAAWVWTDGADMEGDVKAQNIQFDGTLGNAEPDDAIFADGFDG